MEKSSYNVKDVIRAGYTLEPLKCRHCGAVGEVVYNQYIGDGTCQVCGEEQLDEKGY